MRKIRFILFVALFNLAFLYVLFELGTRYVGLRELASGEYILGTMAKIKADGVSIEEYVSRRRSTPNERRLVFDDEIGWNRKADPPLPCATPDCAGRFRILVLGDSVTQGMNVNPGEDWPHILARSDPDRIEVLNAGVDGYGLYQMYLKAERELKRFPADLIVFAYIDHDIMRPAAPYLWGLTQPVLTPGPDSVSIAPPEPMEAFIRSFDRARSYFHIGLWTALRSYEKRRYYFPVLYRSYFERVQAHILERILKLAETRKVPVVLLRLPQDPPFRGRELMREAMDRAWTGVSARSERLSRPDVGKCVRNGLKRDGVDPSLALNLTHPGAAVHNRHGKCVFEQVVRPFLSGR